MGRMSAWRALGALLLCIALVVSGTVVDAQSSDQTGIIQIKVVDAEKQTVLENARVFLLGPSVASALTNRTGIVKYTDVPSGLYRVRIAKAGYRPDTSAQFEVLGNKEVDIDVSMAASATLSNATAAGAEGGLKIIGRVQARVSIATHDVDENSAIRRISDSLLDALNTVAGVDVTQDSNDPDSPQTISLHGHDESQTAVTLDGIPLSAPGTAVNLRGINTDLFTGASASFGARAGALGGGVNFSTLQPTQTWQEQFKLADGSYDKYNWSFGETGSIGKLGIALLTTKRGGNNPLTFQDYLDQSGQTYPHGGESTSAGDLIKLRYALTDTTTLTLTALENNNGITPLCTQFTGPLPCGDRAREHREHEVSVRVRDGAVARRPGRAAAHRLHVDAIQPQQRDRPYDRSMHRRGRRVSGRRPVLECRRPRSRAVWPAKGRSATRGIRSRSTPRRSARRRARCRSSRRGAARSSCRRRRGSRPGRSSWSTRSSSTMRSRSDRRPRWRKRPVPARRSWPA